MICGRSVEVFLDEIRDFHGFVAPGLVLGGFMVDIAKQGLEQGVEADVIVETSHCLPDAVQILTPCTIGNGWMKILDWDKFALTFYDRHQLNGYRVWLDLNRAENYPNIYKWFLKLVPKNEFPIEVLLNSILEAERNLFSCREVQVTDMNSRTKKGELGICPVCREAYSKKQGEMCLSCQGSTYGDD